MYCLQHCSNCDKIMSPSEEAIVEERSEGEYNDVCLECLDSVVNCDHYETEVINYDEDY